MDVIIVSKTHMSSAACVGGVLANGRFVRLLNSEGYNQDSDTDLEVGARSITCPYLISSSFSFS